MNSTVLQKEVNGNKEGDEFAEHVAGVTGAVLCIAYL